MLGLFLLGIPEALINILGIFDMLEILKKEFEMDNIRASDHASAIYNIGLYLGESLGPIIGGSVSYYENFETSCLYIGLINAFFAFVFWYFVRNKIFEHYDEETNFSFSEKDFNYIKLTDEIHLKDCIYDKDNKQYAAVSEFPVEAVKMRSNLLID